ncbi:disrupted in renal carcinoma protein 2 homolog isoform X2 [Centruroides sculpturatus]|uniref:disrupted in renal carcinoma protein 2 homolog isoform X2 n=1 Tax=Centruroides sculpturatus TaxID=218467 RepID=UPI000C6D4EE3|nr:disrupted in renal carcinoma protein 2 homolog isoform X2 [Centruroides sculpturatus]
MTPTPKELLVQKDDENRKLLPCSTPANYNSIGINTESSIVNVQTFRRRWWILALFSVLCLVQSLAWITWSTIPESAKAIFGWNDGTLALLADWGNIPFVILGIPICWFLNKRGLRLSVVLTSVLVFVATGLRCISHKTEIATPLIHVAQILNGIAGVIVTGAPSLLSSIWFPTKQRTTATSISILCNYMGVCLGFLLGPVILDTSGLPPCFNETWGNLTHGCINYTSEQLKTFVHNHTQRIMCLMYFECILAALVLLLICIYFPGKPPLPPTASAHLDRLDFITSFKLLRKNTNFWIISLGYAITNSTFANWISMLGVALESLNITQDCRSGRRLHKTHSRHFVDYRMRQLHSIFPSLSALSSSIFRNPLSCGNHHRSIVIFSWSTIHGINIRSNLPNIRRNDRSDVANSG